uniref:Eukaryotic translation initiation factor 3 subunit B n=1 Tax=Noctiluca scintillans TaxID=2966 RepID=A0A7S0ZMM6_NOCSC
MEAAEEPVKMDESFPGTIFVQNIPKVGQEKYDKLMGILSKMIDKSGRNEKYMPINEKTGQTDGFMIVTYKTEQEAIEVVKTLDGWEFDRKHTFKVIRLETFDQIINRSEEFVPKNTLNSFSREDFRDWLCDKKCREQFLLRYNTETEIYWHDTMAGSPQLCYGGEREKRLKKIWCDWKVQWSPWGSYIVTFHAQGVAIWAGDQFQRKMRFPHDSVKHVDFSPNEEFILTWNGSPFCEKDNSAVKIFRVMTGEPVRTCRTPAIVPNVDEGNPREFPHFLWSHDGMYFAELSEASIIIRDTVDFQETKKPIKLKYEGLHTCQWSPKENLVAVWILEKDNNPARLVLVEIPTMKELTSRSRTQVKAKMHWQSEGDFLCLLVTKQSKKKEGATNLEIFRIRERNIPVDIVEVKDTVCGFFWETKGNRFAVITKDEQGAKPKLLFFLLGPQKCENVASFDLPSSNFSKVFWAPDGQYFVCAAIGTGDLLFGGLSPENKLEILHKDEHFMLTDVHWDPSSRYVVTAVLQPMKDEMNSYKYQMEAGYAIWTFQGRVLFRQQKEKLYQITWRPRPPSLLKPDQEMTIRKNIKQYSKRYDALDEQAKEAARQAWGRGRQQKINQFKEVLERVQRSKAEIEEENGWKEAWEEHFDNQGWTSTEHTIEEELEVSEDLIS